MFGKTKEIESLRTEIEAKNAEIETIKSDLQQRILTLINERFEAEQRANIAENELKEMAGKWREKWRDAEKRRIHAYHAAERFKKKAI